MYVCVFHWVKTEPSVWPWAWKYLMESGSLTSDYTAEVNDSSFPGFFSSRSLSLLWNHTSNGYATHPEDSITLHPPLLLPFFLRYSLSLRGGGWSKCPRSSCTWVQVKRCGLKFNICIAGLKSTCSFLTTLTENLAWFFFPLETIHIPRHCPLPHFPKPIALHHISFHITLYFAGNVKLMFITLMYLIL